MIKEIVNWWKTPQKPKVKLKIDSYHNLARDLATHRLVTIKLVSAINALLDDVSQRHPEIKEAREFKCPYFQRLATLVQYWKPEVS